MKIHIVKKGDSLYELSKKYQTTLEQIIALNPQIADPNQIEIGMKVKIPSGPKHVEPPASEYVYKHVVAQGDSLWKLGKAWDVPLQAMLQANTHLKNPNVLMTGDIVFVPKMHQGHGHTHTNQHHHDASSKLSTEPFPAPIAPQMPPVETYQQPIMPSPEMPHVQTPELSKGETVPVTPQPSYQQAPMVAPVVPAPVMPAPVIPVPITEGMGLHEPYGQAVHPFQQFHISATEVSVHPAQQQEAMTYPSYFPDQEEPCEPLPSMIAPVMVVDQGCGCGGPSMTEQPWMNYPANYSQMPMGSPWDAMPATMPMGNPWDAMPPTMPMGNPWDAMPPTMPMGNPWDAMPSEMPMGNPWDAMPSEMPMDMPGFYPPAMPYDSQMAQHYAFQHDPYGIPYAGGQYQAPYESTILPQVHTHELTKVKDTEAELDIDIRDKAKGAKSKPSSHRSTRKVKLSGQSALSAFLREQERASEKREVSRQNTPWINL